MSRVTAVVAVARNGVIGNQNAMPWHVPEDLKRFKALTSGHPVIMGRKTYDSILTQLGRPLPRRPHWVVTRQTGWAPHPDHARQVQTASSLDQAIIQARAAHPDTDLMVVGGAEIYRQAMATDLLDRVELTLIDLEPEGDAFFPLEALRDPTRWTWALAEDRPAGEGFEFWRVTRQREPSDES